MVDDIIYIFVNLFPRKCWRQITKNKRTGAKAAEFFSGSCGAIEHKGSVLYKKSSGLNLYQQILTKYWGYLSFRPLQDEIIKSVVNGHDTLGLMPTGGGKSLTYQVPALARDGLCLVVTP